MEKKITLKNLFVIILSLISILGLNVNIYHEAKLMYSFDGNSVNYVLYFVVLIYFMFKSLNIMDKRIIYTSLVFAFIFSLIQVLGNNLQLYNSLSYIFYYPSTFLKNVLKLIGYFSVGYAFTSLAFNYLSSFKFTKIKEFKLSLKSIWLIIFLCYIPYLLIYFPGILSADSIWQLEQALGVENYTNHHPIFHTLLIKFFINVGKIFTDDINFQLVFYSVFQMAALSFSFAYIVDFMRRKGLPRILIILSMLFFALFPVNAIYSITFWKDILFSSSILLYTTSIIEMCINTDNFFSSRKEQVKFIVTTLLVILFKNNGVYLIVLSMPVFIIFIKKYRKKMSMLFAALIAFYAIYTGPVFKMLDVSPGSVREALSVPFQQVARVLKYNRADINEHDIKFIDEMFNGKNVGEYYNPRLSDPVKGNLNDVFFEDNKGKFFAIWFKLGIKYPMVYVDSYLSNSFGYWYPETIYWNVQTETCKNNAGVKTISLLPAVMAKFNGLNIYNSRTYPVISMLFSIGFYTTTMLFTACLIFIKRQYKFLLVFLPISSLLLTVTASPVYAEYRYVYSLPLCLVLILCFGLNFPVANKLKINNYKQKI